MSVYTAGIPLSTDDPSQSQGQLLGNFQTLNTLYGSSGDHFPWTNTAVGTIGRHAKVTLPRLPIANNPPGDVTPTAGAAEGVIYVKDAVSQSIPYFRRDGNAADFPLLPIRAMGRFTYSTGTAIGTAFNLAVTADAGTITPTLSFDATNKMPDANYLVLVTTSRSGGGGNSAFITQGSQTTASFGLFFSGAVPEFNVVVLHYA